MKSIPSPSPHLASFLQQRQLMVISEKRDPINVGRQSAGTSPLPTMLPLIACQKIGSHSHSWNLSLILFSLASSCLLQLHASKHYYLSFFFLLPTWSWLLARFLQRLALLFFPCHYPDSMCRTCLFTLMRNISFECNNLELALLRSWFLNPGPGSTGGAWQGSHTTGFPWTN